MNDSTMTIKPNTQLGVGSGGGGKFEAPTIIARVLHTHAAKT